MRLRIVAIAPPHRVKAQVAKYRGAEVTWAQEEPENMGAWGSMLQQFMKTLGTAPTYAGRPEQASPAVGSLKRHGKEQAKVIASALDAGATKKTSNGQPQRNAHGE